MATMTLKAEYKPQDDAVGRKRAILCHSKNLHNIYFRFEDETQPVPKPAVPVVLHRLLSGPLARKALLLLRMPLKAAGILLYVIGQNLKVEEVLLTMSIKDLVGGKSKFTLPNEILGDLQLEFTSAPEKGKGLPLEELGIRSRYCTFRNPR